MKTIHDFALYAQLLEFDNKVFWVLLCPFYVMIYKMSFYDIDKNSAFKFETSSELSSKLSTIQYCISSSNLDFQN